MQHPSYSGQEAPQRLTIGVLYGFRALMVLFVCNYHIWQLGWLPQYANLWGIPLNFDYWTRSSYLFVDGMLLLSGFLLYLPYARQHLEGTPVPTLGRFYANRVRRIVPSYLLSVLVMLFLVALPQGAYRDSAAQTKDVLTHLTFTFNLWPETYLLTPLNGALWTVAVEMQFYLIFPLLARGTQKKPALTLGLMAACGIGYRIYVHNSAADLAPLVNQMPAFLDVYALGMLGAIFYVHWHKWAQGTSKTTLGWFSALAALLFCLSCLSLSQVLQVQSSQGLQGIVALHKSQLLVRLPFALCMLWAMLSAAMMPRFLQKLLDNKLMRFLATISFNLYIWHQVLSAQIARAFFPDTLHSDRPLQHAYTLMCFCCSIVAAMVATYGVELPAAKGLNRLWSRLKARRGSAMDKRQAAVRIDGEDEMDELKKVEKPERVEGEAPSGEGALDAQASREGT